MDLPADLSQNLVNFLQSLQTTGQGKDLLTQDAPTSSPIASTVDSLFNSGSNFQPKTLSDLTKVNNAPQQIAGVTNLPQPNTADDEAALHALMDAGALPANAKLPPKLASKASPQVVNNDTDSTTPAVDPSAGHPAAYKSYVQSFMDKYQVPSYTTAQAIVDAARNQGEDPDLYFRISKQESKFNPNAVNKSTGATGLFQFLPSTFKDIQTRLGGAAQGIKNAMSPQQNAQAAVLYMQDLKNSLASVKDPDQITDKDLYLAHFAGAGGAKKAIQIIQSGAGNRPATAAFNPSQIRNNKPVFYGKNGKLRTVQQVYDVIGQNIYQPTQQIASR